MATTKKAPPDPLESAVAVLKKKGSPIPVRELLETVADQFKVKANPDRAQFMAALHTSLSLDNHVVAAGGQWAMKEWVPKPKTRTPSIKAPSGVVRKKKAAVAVVEVLAEEEEDEEDLLDEEAELPVEEDSSEDEDEKEWD